MQRRVMVGTLVALSLASGVSRNAQAQEAVSILRGTLADALAERAGDGPERRVPTDPADEPVADDLATLTEDQLDRASGDGAAQSRTPPGAARVEAADGDGNEAGIRLRAGYDTNYDELYQPEGSRFVELSGDIATVGRAADTDLFLSASGTVLELTDLDLSERFGGEIAGGARREIGDGVFLEAAAGVGLDGYDDPVTVEPAAAVALQFVQPFAALAVRGSFDAEETILTRLEENEEDADIDDYRRLSLETTAVLAPDAILAPVVSGRISRVRFPKPTFLVLDEESEDDDGVIDAPADEDAAPDIDAGDDADDSSDEGDAEDASDDEDAEGQDEASFARALEAEADSNEVDAEGGDEIAIERDATDMTIAAGLRLHPVEGLLITASARANRRQFDQPGAKAFHSYAPDIEIAWTPSDDTELTLSTTRIIGQPDEAGSLAQDVRSYAAAFSYDPELGFGFSASGGYSQIREVGVDVDSDEGFAELTLAYKPLVNAIVEANILQTWTKDTTFGEDTNSTQVSGGVRATF